jgi:hypothetical protein
VNSNYTIITSNISSFRGHPPRQGQEQSSTEEISLQTPGSVNDTGLTISHPPSGLKFYMMFLGIALALVFSGLVGTFELIFPELDRVFTVQWTRMKVLSLQPFQR